MKRTTTLLAAAGLLSLPALAQTPASATVRTGCTAPAPIGSLAPTPTAPLTFLPDNGDLFVMECESIFPRGNWVEETDLTGFGGCSYLRWDGPNLYNTPGQGVLPFRFEVQNANEYLMRIHVRHDDPDPTEENDCWVRMDGGPWVKLYNNYNNGQSVGFWNWESVLETTELKPRYVLSQGTHLLEISGRSHNFMIDRVHLMPQTTWGTSTQFPESERLLQRPILGANFSVDLGDPCNQGGMTPGIALASWFASMSPPTDPCGTLFHGQEILIALSPATIRAGAARIWNGPGSPATFSVPIPNDPGFLGLNVYTQGVLLEPGKFMLTDALDLVIGDS